MLKISKAVDPMFVQQIVVLCVGQPGSGKTSLGFTSDKPLLLDFDKGSYRSAFRKDTVTIEAWEDIASLRSSDIKDYSTIVVDTGGRALDAITAHIVSSNPKLARPSGALTLQGYGELKAVFTNWTRQLRQLGKDILILAHDAEDKNGDNLIVRPDFQGGSRQEIIKIADAIGYLHKVGKETFLDFNPNESWIAKNCAGLEPLIVPDFSAQPDYMAMVIQRIKDTLNRQTEAQKEAAVEMGFWHKKITAAENAEGFNALISECSSASDAIKQNVWRLLVKAAQDNGLDYDRKEKSFFEKVAA